MSYEGILDNDFHCIIVWNSNKDLINKIESKFNNNFIYKQTFSLSSEEKLKKLKKVYYPFEIKDYDLRINSDLITLYILRLFHAYEYVYRSEGFRLCNKEILNFKLEIRNEYDYTNFHCTDNVNETIQCLEAFELNDYIPYTKIVNVEDVYHFIHESDYFIDSLVNSKYKLVQLKDSPVVKYLQGYKQEYENGSAIFKPRPFTLDYFTEQNPKFSIYSNNYEVNVIKFKDKYIVADGMHRSSVLYYYGYRHLFVKEITNPKLNVSFTNYLNDNIELKSEQNSHLENFYKFIFKLNNANIRYVIIRGFKHMPFAPDTDLDLVIHYNDYSKFLDFVNYELGKTVKLVNSETFQKDLYYNSYQTIGTYGDHLPNNSYQIDIYSNLFFKLSNIDALALTSQFVDYVFNNKHLYLNFYIPDIYSEIILLICRCYFDKFGNFSQKHKERINELINNINFDKYKYIEIYDKIFNIDYMKNWINFTAKDTFFLD